MYRRVDVNSLASKEQEDRSISSTRAGRFSENRIHSTWRQQVISFVIHGYSVYYESGNEDRQQLLRLFLFGSKHLEVLPHHVKSLTPKCGSFFLLQHGASFRCPPSLHGGNRSAEAKDIAEAIFDSCRYERYNL